MAPVASPRPALYTPTSEPPELSLSYGGGGGEAAAKATWLRRLDSVRLVGAAHLFGGTAAPPVPAAAASNGAECTEYTEYTEYWEGGGMHWLRDSFACQYRDDDHQAMAALGKRGRERARLAYPYLELARRVWLSSRPYTCSAGSSAPASSPSEGASSTGRPVGSH